MPDVFTVEYSPSDRAHCKYSHCDGIIHKEQLRVTHTFPAAHADFSITQHFHPACFFLHMEPHARAWRVTSTEQLLGFEDLKAKDQHRLQALVQKGLDKTVKEKSGAVPVSPRLGKGEAPVKERRPRHTAAATAATDAAAHAEEEEEAVEEHARQSMMGAKASGKSKKASKAKSKRASSATSATRGGGAKVSGRKRKAAPAAEEEEEEEATEEAAAASDFETPPRGSKSSPASKRARGGAGFAAER